MNKYFPVKDKIVEVALEQFLKHGIRSMTIKKLIGPMGISTKTVYKYFSSKEDLLAECLRVLYGGHEQQRKPGKSPAFTLQVDGGQGLWREPGVFS